MNHGKAVKELYGEAIDIINSDMALENYRILFHKMHEEILNKRRKIE